MLVFPLLQSAGELCGAAATLAYFLRFFQSHVCLCGREQQFSEAARDQAIAVSSCEVQPPYVCGERAKATLQQGWLRPVESKLLGSALGGGFIVQTGKIYIRKTRYKSPTT